MIFARRIGSIFLGTLLFASVASAELQDKSAFTATLHKGVTVTLNINRYSKGPSCVGETVFAVHGLAHTANTFGSMATHLLYGSFRKNICTVYALDLPGHGLSGLPRPATLLRFGDLTIDDYAAALLQALARLRLQGKQPSLLIGHSMGGVIVQRAEEMLLALSTNLRGLGVRSVLLISPSFPRQVPWYASDVGAFNELAAQLTFSDPNLGNIIGLPADLWVGLFFGDTLGGFPAGTPSPEVAQSLGYIAYEASKAANESLGVNGKLRPSVRRGAFGARTGIKLGYVALGQDGFTIFPTEDQSLFKHLTAGPVSAGFFALSSADAVHDAYISNPALLDAAVRYLFQ